MKPLADDSHLACDVCVVGAGAGGAVAAKELAERGLDVVLLEEGPAHRAEDFTQREDDVLPRLYREGGRQATHDKALVILQGRGLGGSTTHNTGMCFRAPPGILERWRGEHGVDCAPDALAPVYERVERHLGVRAILDDEVNANNRILRRGADALGWRHVRPRHNRIDCEGCGYCMLGCAYNRKQGPLLTYVPRARAAGARVLAGCAALRIEVRDGRKTVRAARVDVAGRPRGDEIAVCCDALVLAAGAIGTPALLLRSGLGNRRVGRGLRVHPGSPVTALFAERVDALRGLPQSVAVTEFASFVETGYGGYILVAGAVPPGMGAVLLPGIGEEHLALVRRMPHIGAGAVLVHDETEGEVSIDRRGRPAIRYWPDASDRAVLRDAVSNLARLYLAAGAERVILPSRETLVASSERELDRALERLRIEPHRVELSSVHPQGTCARGADPDRSACDPEGGLRGAPRIWIACASAFPSSIGAPPQLTVMAFATQVAERVAADLGR